jgi:hypothetical protein
MEKGDCIYKIGVYRMSEIGNLLCNTYVLHAFGVIGVFGERREKGVKNRLAAA